jgi:hypothetical protein
MMANSRKGFPKTFGEGLTTVGDALADIGTMRGLSAQEEAFQKQATAAAEGAIPAEARTPAVTPGPQASADTETAKPEVLAYARPDDSAPPAEPAATPTVATAPPPAEVEPGVAGPGFNPLDAASAADPWMARSKAIAGIETGGEKDPYTSLGKVIPRTGDRAHGKYQIMGVNIPSWTQAATGQALTPQQFLASPAAQEATFRHRFGQYADKYGDEGAARAWYAGEHGMHKLDATDVHERLSVRDYGRDFMNRMAPYNRDRVAASITPQPPTAQPDTAPPSSALPLTASDTTASDLPPEITQGFSARPPQQPQIPTAPPQQPIRQAPQVQVAQAGQQPAPTPSAREPLPTPTPMDEDEKRGYRMRAKEQALGIPLEQQQSKGLIDLGVKNRAERDAALMQDYRDRLLAARTEQAAQAAFARGAPERAQEAAARQEALTKAQQENKLRAQFGNMPPDEVFKQVNASKTIAKSAQQALVASQNATKAIDGGAILGSGANQRLDVAKLFTGMGLVDKGNLIANTEVFKAAMQPIVASILHQTSGTSQLSDNELAFAKSAAAGNITLDPQSIRQLIAIIDKRSNEVIKDHQTLTGALFGKDNAQANALFGIEAPKAPDPLEGKTATGPNGHQLIRRNGQWVEK